MCGYVFVSSRGERIHSIDPSLLQHRGPDYSEEVSLDWCTMRHWRLSIQDLSSHSNQPFARGDKHLLYNGEIYGFRHLGNTLYSKNFQSDTELLSYCLEHDGFELLRNESGFYSFLNVSSLERRFFGARDNFGKKPMYFYLDSDLLVVGSEESAIRSVARQYGRDLAIDSSAIAYYFQYKDLHFGDTFFRGIRELAPGATLEFDFENWCLKEGTSWVEYYGEVPFYKRKEAEFLKGDGEVELSNFVSEAVGKRFLSDVPVQIALSGGIDSTLLALIAKFEEGNEFERALTVSSNSRPSELVKSQGLCERFSIRQSVVDFEYLDVLELLKESVKAQGGPLSHPHALAVYALTKEAAKQGKVLITGEGADELMYGYEHHKKAGGSFAFAQHHDPMRYFYIDTMPVHAVDALVNDKNTFERNDWRDLEVKTHLLSLLRRNDRISMRNSIELRAAFLDYKLFKAVAALQGSGDLKKGKGFLVEMIAEFFAEYEVDEEKIGFYVPFDAWFKKNIENDERLRVSIQTAIDYLNTELQWKIRDGIKVENKLAWSLLNIGVFLECQVLND